MPTWIRVADFGDDAVVIDIGCSDPCSTDCAGPVKVTRCRGNDIVVIAFTGCVEQAGLLTFVDGGGAGGEHSAQLL